MVIVRILGGLGNQMFQYAAGLALSEKNQTNLKLDISGYADNGLRDFDLGKFKIEFQLASPGETGKLKPVNRFQRLQQRFLPYSYKTFYKEPHFHFDRSFFRLKNEIYIQGYFQSEKYFSSIAKVLQKQFDLSHLIAPENHELGRLLQAEGSVAIHIRRGDYQNETAQNFHGILPNEYYARAIAYMKQHLQQPSFYIFSDSPEKARKDLELPDATIVSRKENSHFDDLYLMSKCKHNIIANSSFSWWAAWLNQNPDKKVVAPKNWFKQGPKDTGDILPAAWMRF